MERKMFLPVGTSTNCRANAALIPSRAGIKVMSVLDAVVSLSIVNVVTRRRLEPPRKYRSREELK